MLLCLKVVYIVYNSHNLPVCFHFSSLFTNPNTHLTSHIPHPPLYNALTIVPLLVVAPSHCTAPLLNIIVLSHCNTAATLHCSNHFGYVLPLRWARLTVDPTTRSYLQQSDFVKIIGDLQRDPNNLNLHLKGQRIMQALHQDSNPSHQG
ncbi:hypothetical protein JHK86_039636 [Glycine max]|nr:hypothetical protein JHK86_039636 [Glycine max]